MDTSILLWLHNMIPTSGFLTGFFEVVSKFGSAGVILLIGIIATFIYLFSGKFNKAHMILLSAIFIAILQVVIKNIIGRPRPDLFPPLIAADGFSMPSGHAMVSMAIYGLFAYFFCETRPEKKKLIYTLCGIFVFLVGFSRLYLGVHWPTDVIAGWGIGALVLYIMIWWYHHGGISRTLRIIIGLLTLVIGAIGIIIPIIPGIPLIIAAVLLIFSSKSIKEMLSGRKKDNLPAA
jgi:undecaprenyl-diphosphatase